MPLIVGEGEDWNNTEVALDRALCNFCNDVSDRFDPVDVWNESVQHSFLDLCKAYNDWYSWRLGVRLKEFHK